MCIWYFNIEREALLQKLLQHPAFERQLFCNLRFCAFPSLEVCSYYKTKRVLCIDFCLESLIFHTTGTSVSRLKIFQKRVVCSGFLIKSLKNTSSTAQLPLFTVEHRFYIYRLYSLHIFVSTWPFGVNSAARLYQIWDILL